MKTPQPEKHVVLWADDDPDDLLLMREVLEQHDSDHIVIEAAHGREVISYLSAIPDPSHFPCLIILDINMPVLDGRETLALIRKDQRYASIPVIMFTTSESERGIRLCATMGAPLYTKPTSYKDLDRIVKTMINHCNPVVQGKRA